MRVFVTGATGLVGFAVVQELIAAGHLVTGLARSEGSATRLTAIGAKVLRGDIEDLEVLRAGAAAADGVIHTAFYHEVTHMRLSTRLRVFLGGLPTGIVMRFLGAALAADRRAIETMGEALMGEDRALVATFGTLSLTPGRLGTEDQAFDPQSLGAPRGATEATLERLASKGVRTSVIRLAPVVHGQNDRNGFIPMLIRTARKKGESAYLGDGLNRWPAAHKLDVARLYRLALELGLAGGVYHGVAEEGIAFRKIAQAIGTRLSLPTTAKPLAEAQKQFGFLGQFIAVDNPTSSRLTQERLGWRPTHAGLLADLDEAGYFKAR
jgi:nucleoside-diphosphate-sugar epimerase